MRFPNAQKGVSKLFTSQILMLIAAACGVLGGVFMFINMTAALIFGIAFAVLMIIGYILELVGLGQSQKDDRNFKIAFIAAIVGLILMVLSSIFTMSPTLSTIIKFVSMIASICVTVFVIVGIRSVAEQLPDEKLVKKANRQLWLIVVIYAIGIIVGFIGNLLGGNETGLVIAGILSIAGSIIQIIAYILFLILLGSAKKSFQQ